MAIYARLENGTYAEVTGVYKTDGTEITEIFRGDRLVYTTTNEIYGTLPLYYDGLGYELIDYLISGDAVQDGTPSVDAPVDAVGCGVRTGNLATSVDVTTSENIYIHVDKSEMASNTLYSVSFYSDVTFRGNSIYLNTYNPRYSRIIGTISGSGQVSSVFSLTDSDISAIDNASQFLIRVYKSETDFSKTKNVMLNLGSEALPYEPYCYKLLPTVNGVEYPIYLGQVETTRRIKKLVLTGKEFWQLWNGNYFSSVIDQKGTISTILCTHFINSSTQGISYNVTSTSGLKIASVAVPFVSSVDNLKAWLADEYTAGTPVTVWYVLAEPETAVVNEPLMKIGDYADTVSFAQAGVTIPTVNGANVLDMASTVKTSEVYIKGKGIKPAGYGQLADVNGVNILDKDGRPIYVHGQ